MIKKYILAFFLIILVLPLSCKKSVDEPPVAGNITVSSQLFGTTVYYPFGYSFERDEFVRILNMNEDVDIVPIYQSSNDQESLFFSLPNNKPYGFYLNGAFPSLFSAEIFFASYFNASAPSYTSLTDTIKPNQVYTMRTSRNNWVKFLVKETRLINNTSGGNDYFEADLKYVIQRDGSPVFPE